MTKNVSIASSRRMVKRLGIIGVVGVLTAVVQSCAGGGSPSSPGPNPAPTPIPTPSPAPVPSPTTSPCTVGFCEEPTTNHNPVVRVILKLYQCFDGDNQPAFCPDPVRQVVTEPIPVGYRIRLDVTGRDADQHDTNGVSNGEGIAFIYSDPSFVDEHVMSNWQRKLLILKAGKWEVYSVFDDVASNSLGFTFVR